MVPGQSNVHVLLIIVGLLLLIFGGGCTLLIAGSGLMSNSSEFLSDIPLVLSILLPFGILPAISGWFLFRYGLKRDREKRLAHKDIGNS